MSQSILGSSFRRVSPHAFPSRGFALLITVTLLAFLILLLVSLATLTRVETQVAGNTQNIGKARQNALLALNIALGQLQKYAGPDQRITTTADLLATQDKAGTAAPAPLFDTTTQVNVQPGARFWTAAWGNQEATIGYSLSPDNIPPAANRRGVTPGLLNWLVSGNEATAFSSNGIAGAITPGTGINYAPGDTVVLTDSANPTIKGNPAVILVGSHSVGTSATAKQDYIVAPLVDLTVSSSAIPGANAAAGPTRIGRYAWWIGDEGVKARINLQNGYQATGSSLATDGLNSFITAQRSAVEVMDRDPVSTATPAQIGADFDFTNPGVPNIFFALQLPLANTVAAAQTRLAQASQYRFHDLTTQSQGVLSDPYAGGLKKDLTADLADTSANYAYRPTTITPAFTPLSTSEQNLPTWGHLRSWARTNPDTVTGVIDASSADAKAAGIAPVVLFAGLGMNYTLGEIEGTGRRLIMAFYPMVVLYNPYSWPIKASDYDVGIRLANYSGNTGAITPHNTFQIRTKKAAVATYTATPVGYVDLNAVAIYPRTPAPAGLQNSFFRLHVSALDKNGAARDIPPGQRFAYMLTTTSVSEYSHASPPELRRVDRISDETTNYFTLTSPVFPAAFNDPTDNIILWAYTGTSNNSGTNPYSLFFMETSVVLADSGSLSNPSWAANNSSRFRSAMLNSFPLMGGGVNNVQFCQLGSDPDPEPIANRLLPESPKAKTAFRMVAVNESRGDPWSTCTRGGFPNNIPLVRFIADANIRAPFLSATALENDNSRTVNGATGTRHTVRPFGTLMRGGDPDSTYLDPFPGPSLKFGHYSFGFQHPSLSANERAILFDLLKTPDNLLSLGQLQHVPWARYSFNTSYPFANSYAPLRIDRTQITRPLGLRRPEDMMTAGASAAAADPLYDLSWLLNRTIWDKYFVSGIPSSWTQAQINAGTDTQPLPNARMSYYSRTNTAPNLDSLKYTSGSNRAYDQAAANLLVKGSFNINSTSEQAWRAVLAGSKGLPTDPAYTAAADSVATAIPYPRFSRNITALATASGPYEALVTTMKLTATTEASIRQLMQTTNRGLYLNNPAITGNTSAQKVVAELARSIVNEIRTRGPFLSLSDFINRPLTPNTEPAGIKGALQAGLDNMDPAVAQANPDVLASGTNSTNSAISSTSSVVAEYHWDREHLIGRAATNGRGQISGTRYAMSPIQLTQADLLSSLGPMLSARSDTFTVRTYGETTNPATGNVEGRAWCEAVVQRLPDYSGGEAAETAPANLTTTSSQTFGRKFKVISFRWLSPSDI